MVDNVSTVTQIAVVNQHSNSIIDATETERTTLLSKITKDGGLFRYAKPFFLDDSDLILSALSASRKCKSVRQWELLCFASSRLRDDFEFVTQVITTHQQWLSFQFVSDRLREDPTIALSAILQDPFAIQWCRPALKKNVNFIIAASFSDAKILQFANQDILWSEEYQSKHLRCLRANFRCWKYLPFRLQVRDEYILACCTNHVKPEIFKYRAKQIQKKNNGKIRKNGIRN